MVQELYRGRLDPKIVRGVDFRADLLGRLPSPEELDLPQPYEVRGGEYGVDLVQPSGYDAEIGGFTEWRSVYDGSLIRREPDTGLVLDDWQDNRLSDRNNYKDTGLVPRDIEPEASEFSNPIREEWTVSSGSVTASDDVLRLNSNDAYVYAKNEAVESTYEFRFDDLQNSIDLFVNIFSPNITDNNQNLQPVDNGYAVRVRGGGIDINIRSGGGTNGTVTTASYPQDSDAHTVKIDWGSDGSFEIFVDGQSDATGQDTTYTASNLTANSGQSFGLNSGGQTFIEWFAVY